MLAPRYYHLVYHDVASQQSPFTKWMNCTITPEEFGAHLDELMGSGYIVSPAEAIASLGSEPDFKRPHFVVWFDDGYQGVYDSAAPELAKRGVVAGVAVNSAFAKRTHTFWRGQLSYLLEQGRLSDVRTALFGEDSPELAPEDIWSESLNSFTLELRDRLGDLFGSGSETTEQCLWKLFMKPATLSELQHSGWYLANHTDSHIAATPGVKPQAVFEDFNGCTDFVNELGGAGDTWIVPFDYATVKPTVNQLLPELTTRCKALGRAFFQADTESTFGRICVQGSSSVIEQIRNTTSPDAVTNRLKKAFSRGWHKLTGRTKS